MKPWGYEFSSVPLEFILNAFFIALKLAFRHRKMMFRFLKDTSDSYPISIAFNGERIHLQILGR